MKLPILRAFKENTIGGKTAIGNQQKKEAKMKPKNNPDGTKEHLTAYALTKQIDSGVTLSTNYGDIDLTMWEQKKLQKFLIKILESREKRFKQIDDYRDE